MIKEDGRKEGKEKEERVGEGARREGGEKNGKCWKDGQRGRGKEEGWKEKGKERDGECLLSLTFWVFHVYTCSLSIYKISLGAL